MRAPDHNADYRREYLCGIVRGDGAPCPSIRYERPGRTSGDIYRFRLAMADEEALGRAQEFLALLEVATTELLFAEANGPRRGIGAIRAQSRSAFQRISSVIEWPLVPSLDWTRGFLAGIFDAEGSCSHGILRVYNYDEEILARTLGCMRRLGFDAVAQAADKRGVRRFACAVVCPNECGSCWPATRPLPAKRSPASS